MALSLISLSLVLSLIRVIISIEFDKGFWY